MKKILTYMAGTLLLMQSFICVVNAAAETVEPEMITISAEETITDTDQIYTILTAYFDENGVDAVCFYAETYDLYPEYAGTIVVEFNYVDSIGKNYDIDYTQLIEFLIEQNIPKESIQVVPLLNGEPYVQETISASKVNENIVNAFASGAQTVEVYILYEDIPVGEISIWAKEQAAIYAETLDKNVYSEEEIVNMEFDYCAEIAAVALEKERNVRTAEILTAIGVDPASAICDENYPRLSCILTQEQVEAANNNELVRRITLKSEWKSAEELGITTEIAEFSDSPTTTTTVATMKITDIEQIRELFSKFIADNELDAKCVSDEIYPQYAGTVVVEFNSETAANTAILEYAAKNYIERNAFNLVPCMNGKPITAANPDSENTTTTTTTTAEAEKITDIEQIREMFTKFIVDNELNAKCVSDEAYPQYAGTVVIEFNSATSANTAILEYAEKNNIERTAFKLVPCVDGKPITTANSDSGNTTTTTSATAASDLPQTGNNSPVRILIVCGALLLISSGAWTFIIARRKENIS